jgi:hypothetical protein
VACGNPSTSYARHRPSHRCPIRDEAISSGPAGPRPGRPEVKLQLPGREPLPGSGLQRLQLCVIVRRADVLDLPRPAPRGSHDLNRGLPRRGRHCANVRHPTRLRVTAKAHPLVRKSRTRKQQTCSSQLCDRADPASVIKVRSHIEVDQAAVRSAGVGQLLVRICPAHVYSQAPDGSLVVQHAACLKCGLPCPGASQDAPLARSARRFRRGIPRAVAGISERLYAANALELRRDSATRVRVGP